MIVVMSNDLMVYVDAMMISMADDDCRVNDDIYRCDDIYETVK